ncbi:MAG: galactose mutarotase [Oscillospiraceae bacterium]|nr:galactose mutarotase [Oscillospiraceae bacterium]
MSVEKRFFGSSKNRDVYLFEIKNSSGASAQILTYGGALHRLVMPGRDGLLRDMVLGFDGLKGYEEDTSYHGRLVGRFANRIAGGLFTVNGETFQLSKNENHETCLHGGSEFSDAVWSAEAIGENVIRLAYKSPSGAEGFPGEMRAEAVYTLTEDNGLIIGYRAVCDQETPVSLTNHAYFNLNGTGGGDVLGHVLSINADSYTPTDEKSIPMGELRNVKGTAFDFTTPKAIGQDIADSDIQLVQCKGYDHNFCLSPRESGEPSACAYSPESGIVMDVYTDMPGVQLYTGNFLSGIKGKDGVPMDKHGGFCLETQFYPDTPNRPEFPPCTIKPGETFKSRTSFVFSVRNL